MSIKNKIYLDNLKRHLGIDNLNEISDEHIKDLIQYLETHKNEKVLSELVSQLPNFLNFATESVKSMKSIVSDLISFGQSDVTALQQIINQLMDRLKVETLTVDDKKEIYKMINRYSEILEAQIKENAELRKRIFGGALAVAAFATLMAGYIAYKALGGKNGEELLTEASRKLIKGV